MKRFFIITVLGVLLIAAIGTTAVSAKQARDSPIYIFHVAATNGHGSGVLIVNVEKHTFVFNGRGFVPDTPLYLRYTIAGMPGTHQFASVVATHTGTVYLTGMWARSLVDLPAMPVFTASATTSTLDTVLTSQYTEVVGVQVIRKAYSLHWSLDASASAGDIVKYTLLFIPGPPGDHTAQIYSGPDPHFAGEASPFQYRTSLTTIM